MRKGNKVEYWDDLPEEEKRAFNLRLGDAVMKGIEESGAFPNLYICPNGHDQNEWFCTKIACIKKHPFHKKVKDK